MEFGLKAERFRAKRLFRYAVVATSVASFYLYYRTTRPSLEPPPFPRDRPALPVEGNNDYIVPNIVHFVRLGNDPLSFVEVVCMRAAWLQQKPDIIMIHCDKCSTATESPHWRHIKDIPRLSLRYIERPQKVFGRKLSWIQHASDIARIMVLRKYGGIYLDKDAYLVRSLDKYRRFETTVGWPQGGFFGNMIIVAHRRSEFLRLHYELYRRYNPDHYTYSAAEQPTKEILEPNPHLVHRVLHGFGVNETISKILYENCDDYWRNYSALHLFFRHRSRLCPLDKFGPVDFDTVGRYRTNFGQMARLVLTGSSKLGQSAVKNITLLKAEALDYSRGCM
ncbi:uncharacterized protein LOC144123655 [Amblyomma americanum]